MGALKANQKTEAIGWTLNNCMVYEMFPPQTQKFCAPFPGSEDLRTVPTAGGGALANTESPRCALSVCARRIQTPEPVHSNTVINYTTTQNVYKIALNIINKYLLYIQGSRHPYSTMLGISAWKGLQWNFYVFILFTLSGHFTENT